MSRKTKASSGNSPSSGGFGTTTTTTTTTSSDSNTSSEEEIDSSSSLDLSSTTGTTTISSSDPEGKIYSLPSLYDLAFGYRNYEEEVNFLLWAHATHQGGPQQGKNTTPNRILEFAAGPARHGIEALRMEDSTVSHVTAVDQSQDMVNYGTGLAKDAKLDMTGEQPIFDYLCQDMRQPLLDLYGRRTETFDSVWILLGSLQHMTSNDDVISCFQSAATELREGGTLILELPHPRETFSMVECTRNGWEVPLEDDDGKEYGELRIVWGDDDDPFDPVLQIRNFTVAMDLVAPQVLNEDGDKNEQLQSVREVVPMRLFTAQEMDALGRCGGFELAAMYGALSQDVNVNDGDEAFRLVCVLRKT
jgi:SAM-dependent methyltransferase